MQWYYHTVVQNTHKTKYQVGLHDFQLAGSQWHNISYWKPPETNRGVKCVISGFHSYVDEICTLMGCYTMCSGQGFLDP
jgi:hypothetical protein